MIYRQCSGYPSHLSPPWRYLQQRTQVRLFSPWAWDSPEYT